MELKKLNDNEWEIPKTGGMRVPGKVYASEKLLESIKRDKTISQLSNVAHLKGIVKNAMVMPDAHQGYGFPIGGVAAFDVENGIVSPGGVGYDICCSVRLLRTDFTVEQILDKRRELIAKLFKNVPSGVGSKGRFRSDKDTLLEVIQKGAEWAIENGYGTKDDLQKTEEYGRMSADHEAVSPRAMKRGMPQLGSLGSGNHFLEIQKVDQIYEPKVAKKFGFTDPEQAVVMIHCGSRGFGHQVASDYIKLMEAKYGHEGLPDRELINAPIKSDLGQEYFKAMGAAVNFTFANKQMITHWVRKTFEEVMGTSDGMDMVYDVAHNIAKMEKFTVDGEKRTLCVHRKGATRSFGPGRIEIPEVYRDVGQPVIIPGSMGTASYVLVGTKKAEETTFGSTAHGAGRVMSRAQAIRTHRGEEVRDMLLKKNIQVKGASWKGIAEEAPDAYKDIDEVIKVSKESGIGRPVVRVVPLGVIKG